MEVETKTSPSLQPRKMIWEDDRHALKRLFISANSASETFSSTNTFRSQSVVVLPYMYEKSSAHGPANGGDSPNRRAVRGAGVARTGERGDVTLPALGHATFTALGHATGSHRLAGYGTTNKQYQKR